MIFIKNDFIGITITTIIIIIIIIIIICGSEKEYQERLEVLKWPSLELRRKFICLVQMYKIIFGHCDIDHHMFFDFNVVVKTRKNHNFKLRPKKTRTNYFKFSFFNRYITD